MNTRTSTTLMFRGSAGQIEALADGPLNDSPIGIAVIAHPHPLQGGSALHKIPTALATCFQRRDWLAIRPNFRGVGASAGQHDSGHGETEDLLQIIQTLREQDPNLPLALAGFSFGAFVQARVAQRLAELGDPPTLTVLAGIPFGKVQGQRSYETPPVPRNSLVIHGDADEVVPLESVLEWARPQRLPVVVFPGANHFLTGFIDTFASIVDRYLAPTR